MSVLEGVEAYSEAVEAICRPRWVEYDRCMREKKPLPRVDPCGQCPLYNPCISKAPVGIQTLGKLNAWITAKNDAAAAIATAEGVSE